MNDKLKRILIVDDSPDDIHFVMEHFSDDYAVIAATSGNKALQLAMKEPQPDIILMDVEMPEMNGYETCRQLKADEATKGIDVIFVTSHDTLEEKLSGYDAGGSDYLIKPVQPNELLQKVKLAINNKIERESINQEKKSVTDTAMSAISNLGEMGVVIEFLKNSFCITNYEELAKSVVNSTSQYGLESTVQIFMLNMPTYASSINPIPPLEQELLFKVKSDTRILESGNRLILNFGGITQIIKNMPQNDEKRGRLRDHMAILLEGADARLKALDLQTELKDVIKFSQRAMTDLEAMQQDQMHQAMKIQDEIKESVEELILGYGLTESQEEALLGVLKMGEERSLNNLEKGLKIDEQMSAIIQKLEKFSAN